MGGSDRASDLDHRVTDSDNTTKAWGYNTL